MKGKKTSIKLGKDTENRMKIYMLAVVVVYSLLMLRLFYLQVFKGAYYKNLSERNRVKMKKNRCP